MPALAEAEASLKTVLQGLWDIAANVWDEPELRVPDEEADPWAAATARALDQAGLLDHTRKLAPAEALARTAAICLPRGKLVAMRQAAKPKRDGAPRKQFVRPPGMSTHRPSAHAGETSTDSAPPAHQPAPPIVGEGYDKPLDFPI